MSTVKVNEVKHLSNTGTANIVLESNATTNLQATSTLGLTVTGTLTVSGVSTLNGNTIVGNASTDTANLISKVTGFNNFSGFTGEIRMYAGNEGPDAPPTGWLYCNGDTISSTSGDGGTHYNLDGKGNDYQPLFNLLKANSNWGNSGSPSWGGATVKLPDFRSRSPVGVHTGAANALPTGLTARTIGIGTSIADGSTLVGKETHALVTAELAAHTHTYTNVASATGQTITNPTHIHTLSSHTHTSDSHTHSTPGSTTSTIAAHTHGISGVTAYRAVVENAPKKTLIEYGQHLASTNTDSGGSHAGLTVPSGTSGSTTPDPTGGPSTPNTSATAPGIGLGGETHNHVIDASASSTGSGTAHTILSPIIAVNYIIKV